MRINLPFDFRQNLRIFLRQAGYSIFTDPNTGQSSYTRRLSRDYYPRFHLYVEQDNENRIFFNLHLDQKKPSYPGTSAHSAEYNGEVIKKETRRLQGLIKNQLDNQKQQIEPGDGKSGFWARLFGR